MNGWRQTEDGTWQHEHCGTVHGIDRGRDDVPTRYLWTDRRGRARQTFSSPTEARVYAMRLSGVQRWSDT